MSATNFKTVLAALKRLEEQGYIFTQEPEGRLGITPHPPADSPILKFASLYKGNILAELAKRQAELDHRELLTRAERCFGPGKIISDLTLQEMFEQADLMFAGLELEKKLYLSTRTIAALHDDSVGRGRAIAYFEQAQ